jgi:thermitase
LGWNGTAGFGDPNVIIAIIDSGVNLSHPDLTLVAGWDYGSGDSNPEDNSSSAGHGTCCAGVAAAEANNGLGACGAAPGCRIMPLKVANNAGSMFFSAIVNAIYHAADNGAAVISMSLGAAITSDPSTDAAILYAYNAGVTFSRRRQREQDYDQLPRDQRERDRRGRGVPVRRQKA